MQNIQTSYIYRGLDICLIFLSCSLAYLLRFNTLHLSTPYLLPTTTLIIISLLSLSTTGLYTQSRVTDFKKQLNSIAIAIISAAFFTTMFLYLTKTGQEYSRIWLSYSIVISITLISTGRFFVFYFIKQSLGKKPIILLGANTTAKKISDKFSHNNNQLIWLVKQFANDRASLSLATKFIEECRQNQKLQHPIAEVWITHDFFNKFDHEELIMIFHDSAIKIVYIPEVPLFFSSQQSIDIVESIPTINSDMSSQQKLFRVIKFIEDKSLALLGIASTLPLMLIIALAIKIDSRGPVIFKQTRYGINGKEFKIFKFRTMNVIEKTDEFTQVKQDDSRITSIGKFLRRQSLDELPQLFNVIIGDMSLVGPRPHPNLLNEEYRIKLEGYMTRHNAKPGITGLAQIHGCRGETLKKTDMEERVYYDLEYINNWSLLLDIKILLLTVSHLFLTKNAY